MLITFLLVETILVTRLSRVNLRRTHIILASLIMALSAKFQAAVKVIQNLPKDGPYQPANNMKLKFYSLYKQATEGPCNIPKPAFYDIIGRAKWDAWAKLGEMSSEDAMNGYIEELKNIIETMSFSGEVQNFLDSVGPFYEFVTLHGDEMHQIKETIQRATSSASSSSSSQTISSAESSTQNSPINGTLLRNDEKPLQNGYPPNQIMDETDTETVSSKYLPPSAPIHRRSIPHCSKDSLPNGFLENGEHSDEVLEIVDETVNELKRTSPETVNSGTDSDRYYSGESEPDIARHETRKSRGRFKQNHIEPQLQHSSANLSTDLVLQNTVERLNRDVDHILARLRILEAAYATNGQLSNGEMHQASRLRRRRLFGDVSRGTLTLILSWPFVAYFIIKLISWWLARRRRGNVLSLTR